MSKGKVIFGLAACILAMLLVSQSFSAAGGQGGRGTRTGGEGGQPPDRGQMDRNPEQMRARMQEMMDQRLKEQLGITGDDEWKVIQPRLQKVQDLSRQVNAGGMMGMFGRRGGFGGPGGRGPGQGPGQGPGPDARGTAPDRELSAVEKSAQELQDLLATESPKAEDIKAKLTAYRTVREKAKSDLAKAQDELKQIVTVKQEAALVLMGLLN